MPKKPIKDSKHTKPTPPQSGDKVQDTEPVLWDTYFYRAFVAMQYFGYLHRDPDAAGYNDWVDVLTNGRASAGIAPDRD